jgi:hypothetical protein
MDKGPNALPLLLVTEAIREFTSHFKSPSGAADRSNLEAEISRFGRKPGFAMTSQLLRSAPEFVDSIRDIADFLDAKFTPALFDVVGKMAIQGQTITLSFPKQPIWFTAVIGDRPALPGSMTDDALAWYRAYAAFFIGVYSGAFIHFGFDVLSWFDCEPNGDNLTFTFKLQELDGSLEFGGNYHE